MRTDTKRNISVFDAGTYLTKHQRRFGGSSLIEELGGSFRLVSNKDGDPVTLQGEAWRDLSNDFKACVYAMRKHHVKRKYSSGMGKTTEKGTKTNGRQRTKITEEPEKPLPKTEEPPPSFPGLKSMEQSDLAEMLKTLKAQAECMARAQALQSQRNARIMFSLGFPKTPLAADEDPGNTD